MYSPLSNSVYFYVVKKAALAAIFLFLALFNARLECPPIRIGTGFVGTGIYAFSYHLLQSQISTVNRLL